MDIELDRIDKEILLFVGTNKVRYRDMLNYLVNDDLSKRICNKVPFLKHRRKLMKAGWLKLERPSYYIPVELHSELEKLELKEEIKDSIDNLDDLYDLEELKYILEKMDKRIGESREVVRVKLSHLELYGNPEFWKIIKHDLYAFNVGEISGEEYSARLEKKAEAFLERRAQKEEQGLSKSVKNNLERKRAKR